jgi:hypothetical protein
VTPLYYKPSGQLHPAGLALAVLGGLAIAVLAGVAYGYLVVYIPLAGWVTFLLSAGLGAAIGAGTSQLLKIGKVRNPSLSMAVVVSVTLVGYYVSWGAWLKALLGRGDIDVPLFQLLSSPGDMWGAIKTINESGGVNIAGFTPSGGVLWGLWVVELLIIFGAAIMLSMAAGLNRPFCERCRRWCDGSVVALLEPGYDNIDAALRSRLEAKDFDALAELGNSESDWQYFRVQLHACPQCEDFNTLSIDHVAVSIDGEGARSEQTRTIVDHLLLSRGDAGIVRELPSRLASAASEVPAD